MVQANAQPVQFSVDRPDAFERVQVVLRIGIGFVLSWISSPGFWAIFLAGPIVSAILISQRGAEGFHERSGAMYRKALSFVMGVEAYLLWTTDTIPNWNEERTSHLRIESTGAPTVGSALLRFLTVIPHLIVLWILSVVAVILWFVALVTVLVNRSVPDGVRNFQIGFLVWVTRTLAYYLSMVEEYPPFRLEAVKAPPRAQPESQSDARTSAPHHDPDFTGSRRRMCGGSPTSRGSTGRADAAGAARACVCRNWGYSCRSLFSAGRCCPALIPS